MPGRPPMDPRYTPGIPPQFAGYIRNLEKKVDQLAGIVTSIKTQDGTPSAVPGQYAGKTIPAVEGVEVAGISTTARTNLLINISADGPFIAESIHFAWRPTAGANAGHWRPISSVENQLAAIVADVPDFYWEYSAGSSSRNRQRVPIPSCLITNGDRGIGGFSLACPDTFPPNTTVSAHITCLANPSNAGVMWCGFRGYYILD